MRSEKSEAASQQRREANQRADARARKSQRGAGRRERVAGNCTWRGMNSVNAGAANAAQRRRCKSSRWTTAQRRRCNTSPTSALLLRSANTAPMFVRAKKISGRPRHLALVRSARPAKALRYLVEREVISRGTRESGSGSDGCGRSRRDNEHSEPPEAKPSRTRQD